MVTLIWAMNTDRVIGYRNKMPWYIKEDLIHFKKYTIGKTVLMGRKTYESLNFNPLPERKNIILTRDKNFDPKHPDVEVCSDLNGLIKKWKKSNDELVVIGGGEIFRQTIKHADNLVISVVDHKTEGDVYFPGFSFDDYEITEKRSFAEFNVLWCKKKKGS